MTAGGRLFTRRPIHFRWTDAALDRAMDDDSRQTELLMADDVRSKGDLVGWSCGVRFSFGS